MKVFYTTLAVLAGMLLAFTIPVFANQIGLNFSEGSIGGLGDYQKKVGAWAFETDAQVQITDRTSLIANASVARNLDFINLESLSIKPFVSYTRDDVGNIFDGGGVVNFSIGGLDIAAGASFRGVNPAATPLEKRWLGDNSAEVEVHAKGYSPNAYQFPAVNNVNLAVLTGFEKWDVETDLTVYTPITKRDVVPVVVISRSQTSIELPWIEGLSASLVVDARSYIHPDGIEIAFKPFGGVVYRF